jgi:hypothetical protein
MTFLFLLTSALASIHPFPSDALLQLITRNAKNFKSEVVCISVDGTDPSPRILATIKKSLPQAAPASECSKPDRYVVHKPSGRHATIVSASNFEQISPVTATADYSVNSGPLAGNWFIARFRLTNGTWKLVALERNMES